MKRLIILGAGGMGRQICNMAKRCSGYEKEYVIKGFLDDNIHALDQYDHYPPVLDSIMNYQIQKDDVFVNSIGDVETKKKCIQHILDHGGTFLTLISPTAQISDNVKIGNGCIIATGVCIGVESVIGDFTLIQNYAVIGHDVKIGSFCRVDCNCVCIAGVELEDEVCIHTASTINHNTKIGKGAVVGANSFVVRNVKPGLSVFGNPARKVEF